ncbi:amino acid ABC transporter substrate-binding protein [Aliidiomarina haloalkalitolerans]|uniref:Leucine-binding protein domain-containing protein n=1 Tax=Aliidiomarina haloalkalitolerans TaxID=859059 RepID=A0A432VYN5_9GAMM|nr:amino acid ABC transporter substrate-binding protein [Aliidiomarina haloalkalitolerans]MCL4409328.1 amino acid ABC transporter substrate-binding protein [Gammaproteobacteria bacterium]RUO21774.1 hypothetical protein CWE06_02695 [Aliidiomarina haloalkalitolerans]
MNLTKKVGTLLTSALLLHLVGCGQQAQEPLRIGATMSQTGAYQTQGQAARNGYLLCEQDLNAAGGLLGRPVEFVVYDDESSQERARALYEQLISVEQVDAIMGPYGSTLTEAVAPITEKHRYVHISPLAATSSIWEQGRHHLFMVLPPADVFLAGLINMAEQHGYQRVAVLYEDALFPAAAAQGAIDLATSKGMDVVFQQAYTSGTEDFRSYLSDIATAETQVLALAASALTNFVTITQQLKELDINVQLMGTSGAVDEFQHALGADADYVMGLSAWEASVPLPGSEQFVRNYQARFQRAPSFHAAGAYGSCQLLAHAITSAGSLNSDAIRDVLLNLEMTTVFGPFAVDKRGYQTAHQGVFVQWQDGEKRVIWPHEQAVSEPRITMPTWSERAN